MTHLLYENSEVGKKKVLQISLKRSPVSNRGTSFQMDTWTHTYTHTHTLPKLECKEEKEQTIQEWWNNYKIIHT